MTIAVAVLVTALAGSDCAALRPGGASPKLADAFGLRVGESVSLDTPPLEVGLVAVSSDSRCGKGEQCVWEGDATLELRLKGTGEPECFLQLHTAHDREQSGGHGEYTLRLLRLDPWPISGQMTAEADYCAVLEVVASPGPSTALQ
jgi:hypothetical protein